MFSPPVSQRDPNARVRKRPPTSRPSSRTQSQSRRERSGSNASSRGLGSFRAESVASFRRDSSGPADAELSLVRKSAAGGVVTVARHADDGIVDWTSNEKYRVSRLPGVPPVLKAAGQHNSPATATADSSHKFGLILNHTTAFVWNYTTHHSIPHTYTFPLPSEEGYGTPLPFPLGTLVSPSANSAEPGLVIVMPMSGRIAYWDAVGSAVAEGLFSKKRGVEGKVPLMSGESVTAICSIEPAGFILSLSSGRLAHLALRDVAGRPGVSVTVMRGYSGLFGGIFGAVRAANSRKDIIAVRAGKVGRMGEREVIVATARGNFSRWLVNRTGTYAIIAEFDAREKLLNEIEKFDRRRRMSSRGRDQFVIIDVDIGDYTASNDPDGVDEVILLVLGAYMPTNDSESTRYVLGMVQFLSTGEPNVGVIHVVRNYTEAMVQGARPRLYSPTPRKTAFVVFPKAVVVVSATRDKMDPRMDPEEYERKGMFEDVIDFRDDMRVEIVGSGSEPGYDPAKDDPMSKPPGSFTSEGGHSRKARNPAIILLMKGAGVVRVEAFDCDHAKQKAVREPLTVKSKIEQAVFYSGKEDNPINFRAGGEMEYPLEEVERAALEISREILSSSSSYLPSLLPSLDAHLALRASHLHLLADHIKSTFPPLSKKAMWKLLSDAEKCEAARQVWATRDARLQEDQDGGEGVLEDIINQLSADVMDHTGSDPVRTWFLREISQIGELIPLAKKSLVAKSNRGKRDQLAFAKADAEANLIIIGALMTAWEFRTANAELYRLGDDIDDNGLVRNPEELTAPWTSGLDILQSLGDQYDVSRTVLKTLDLNIDEERQDLADKISDHLVTLAEVCCRAFEERAYWCKRQSDEALQEEGETIEKRYIASRGSWIKPLVEIDRISVAYEIAEKWRDYRTLVEICNDQLGRTEIALAEAKVRKEVETIGALEKAHKNIKARIQSYFSLFGKGFAWQMYEVFVERGLLYTLLTAHADWHHPFLTNFLQSSPKYAKIAWIHDIRLHDYERAGSTLLNVATSDAEPVLRNKQVELSIGKLAKLAAGPQPDSVIETFDINLRLIKIQERLLDAIQVVTRGTIDAEAAWQVGLEEYSRSLRRKPGLLALFRRLFHELVNGRALAAEDLVDLLTLMETEENGGVLGGEEFYWALRALALAGLPSARREAAERTIWRRCYIRDDWIQIADTRNQPDSAIESLTAASALATTVRLGYESGFFAADSPFAPRAPADCLFSGEPAELLARFPTAPEADLAAVGQDLVAESTKLKMLMRKAGLGEWFRAVVAGCRDAEPGTGGEGEGGVGLGGGEGLGAMEVDED